MSHEARFNDLKLELPAPVKAVAVYRPVLVVGNMAYVSGHGPIGADGNGVRGKVGADLDKDAAYDAARRTAICMLASLRHHLGSLDKIRRIVKTTGFVNAVPDFKDQPAVINGFSELMRDVFGEEHGVGARSALGVGSLPSNWAVEIEAIFELNSPA